MDAVGVILIRPSSTPIDAERASWRRQPRAHQMCRRLDVPVDMV